MSDPLLRLEGIVKTFPSPRSGFFGRRAVLHAVDGVDLSVGRGETLGLVGESGSGKSTLARLALHLLEPDAGRVVFDGRDVGALDRHAQRALRRRMQIVFQDPYGSFNPRMTIGAAVREPLVVHRLARGREAGRRAAALLEEVGLDPAYAERYPHALSGGQRQRAGIARALSVEPELLVLDEPVSALDVSIQAQVLTLLRDLQTQRGLTYIFIAHDLAIVRQMADRVAVMYAGKVIEEAPAEQLYREPRHPYTAALLSAVPVPDPTTGRRRIILPGDPPSALRRPAGCVFHPRCPHPKKDERCRTESPQLRTVGRASRAACHFADTPVPIGH